MTILGINIVNKHIMKLRILKIILITVFFILMIPLVASQLNSDVNWDIQDYIIAGLILFGAGFLIHIAFNRLKTVKHRTIIIIVLFVLLLLLWAEMGVGIFGSPIAGS